MSKVSAVPETRKGGWGLAGWGVLGVLGARGGGGRGAGGGDLPPHRPMSLQIRITPQRSSGLRKSVGASEAVRYTSTP